jgi:hypothetical protein
MQKVRYFIYKLVCNGDGRLLTNSIEVNLRRLEVKIAEKYADSFMAIMSSHFI